MQRCIPLYRSFASHVATSCGSYGRKTCFSTLQSIRPVAINNRSSSNWLCCPPSNVEIAIFRRCLATEPALKSFGPRNAENDKIEAPSPVKAAAVTTPVQQPHEFDDDNSIEMSLSSSGSTPPATNPNRTKGSRKSKLINRRHVDFGRSRYPCCGFATADQYDNMAKLHNTLAESYAVHSLPEDVGNDAIFCSIRQFPPPTPAIPAFRKDFVVFWDGVVVFWNCTKEDQNAVFKILHAYERGSHPPQLVESEVEHLEYLVADGGPVRVVNNTIVLNPSCSPLAVSETDVEIEPSVLTKFAFSEAVRLSVRLAIWENQLVTLAESVDGVIDDLRGGRRLRISRSDVLRHCGDLLSFRHRVNLASDLLQTPDFYWDRPQLEELFRRTRSFLNVPHRTRLVNEKLNHSFELVELLRSHLNDSHHIRLEWMIIALICIEVVFDAIPTLGRFFMP